MRLWLAVGAGGFIGAVMRFGISKGCVLLFGARFPWGTLVANALGAFAIGFLAASFAGRMSAAPWVRTLILTGLLGALTTFSSFSLETLNLVQDGETVRSALNIVANVSMSLFLVWIGYHLGEIV